MYVKEPMQSVMCYVLYRLFVCVGDMEYVF